jgi:hypothetical protein
MNLKKRTQRARNPPLPDAGEGWGEETITAIRERCSSFGAARIAMIVSGIEAELNGSERKADASKTD